MKPYVVNICVAVVTMLPVIANGDRTLEYTCQVIDVIDGSTVVVSNRTYHGKTIDSKAHVVRLDGIVSPVKGQPGSGEARVYLNSILSNKEVFVVEHFNGSQSLGGWIFVGEDKQNVNLLVITEGYAWPTKTESSDLVAGSGYGTIVRQVAKQLKQEYTKARQKKIGIWTNEAAIPPWEWKAPQEKTPAEQNKK